MNTAQDDKHDISDVPVLTMTPLHREKWARDIAQHLVETFRYTLWGALLGGFVIFLVGTWTCNTEGSVKMLKEGFLPFLGTLGTFATTLFGPLLAFVLGYYFRQEKH